MATCTASMGACTSVIAGRTMAEHAESPHDPYVVTGDSAPANHTTA